MPASLKNYIPALVLVSAIIIDEAWIETTRSWKNLFVEVEKEQKVQLTTGDLVYADRTDHIGTLAAVSAGHILISGGVGAAPVWSSITLPNQIQEGDVLVATSTNTIGVIPLTAISSAFANLPSNIRSHDERIQKHRHNP